MIFLKKSLLAGVLCLLGTAVMSGGALASWEPTKNVEFIVPAGTGGGADQMARVIQGIVQKHNLMKQSIVVINKSGGAGAEGFLDVVASKGNPHKIIITLSNLFTTPLATKVPFNWRNITPVSMLALDNFVLWVNTTSPYKAPSDYIAAIKAAGPNKISMGGTGSKQEDHIITAAIEQSADVKLIYVPFKGGGEVASQLAGGHVQSTVNNPIEAVSQWESGALRPLCAFSAQPLPGEKWSQIPLCKTAGLNVEYQMLRGIFMPADVKPAEIAFYVDLFKKVAETPDWKDFIAKGAFTNTIMTGKEFETWLASTEEKHKSLMDKAGFLAK